MPLQETAHGITILKTETDANGSWQYLSNGAIVMPEYTLPVTTGYPMVPIETYDNLGPPIRINRANNYSLIFNYQNAHQSTDANDNIGAGIANSNGIGLAVSYKNANGKEVRKTLTDTNDVPYLSINRSGDSYVRMFVETFSLRGAPESAGEDFNINLKAHGDIQILVGYRKSPSPYVSTVNKVGIAIIPYKFD